MQTWPPKLSVSYPMVSGRWYDQNTSGVANVGTFTRDTGEIWFVPFTNWSLATQTYTQIAVDLDNNATGADVSAHVGIYRDSNGVPTTKLTDGLLTLPNGASGTPQAAINQPLQTGLYWLAITVSDTVTLGGWDAGSAAQGFGLLGDSNAAATASNIPKFWGWTGAFVFGPLPEDAGTLTLSPDSTDIPRIVLRVL